MGLNGGGGGGVFILYIHATPHCGYYRGQGSFLSTDTQHPTVGITGARGPFSLQTRNTPLWVLQGPGVLSLYRHATPHCGYYRGQGSFLSTDTQHPTVGITGARGPFSLQTRNTPLWVLQGPGVLSLYRHATLHCGYYVREDIIGLSVKINLTQSHQTPREG